MYYHQIDFFTQSTFFIISFIAGLTDGVLALFLCSPVFKGKTKFFFDILFCVCTVLLIVCTNILFQDAALRVYEMIAFLTALLLFCGIFKKRSDALVIKIDNRLRQHILKPFHSFCKNSMNKCKNILKKQREVVYNLIHKHFRSFKRNGKKQNQKSEEME